MGKTRFRFTDAEFEQMREQMAHVLFVQCGFKVRSGITPPWGKARERAANGATMQIRTLIENMISNRETNGQQS